MLDEILLSCVDDSYTFDGACDSSPGQCRRAPLAASVTLAVNRCDPGSYSMRPWQSTVCGLGNHLL